MSSRSVYYFVKQGKVYLIGGESWGSEPHRVIEQLTNKYGQVAYYDEDYVKRVQKILRGVNSYTVKGKRSPMKSSRPYWTTKEHGNSDLPEYQYTFKKGEVLVSYRGSPFRPLKEVATFTKAIAELSIAKSEFGRRTYPIDCGIPDLGTDLYRTMDKAHDRLYAELKSYMKTGKKK